MFSQIDVTGSEVGLLWDLLTGERNEGLLIFSTGESCLTISATKEQLCYMAWRILKADSRRIPIQIA